MGGVVRDDGSDECLSRTEINFYIQTSLLLLHPIYM